MHVFRSALVVRCSILAVLIAVSWPANFLAQGVPATAPPPPSPVGAAGLGQPIAGGPPSVTALASTAPPALSAPTAPGPTRLGARRLRERGRLRAKLRALRHPGN